jgi:hypothetical protein
MLVPQSLQSVYVGLGFPSPQQQSSERDDRRNRVGRLRICVYLPCLLPRLMLSKLSSFRMQLFHTRNLFKLHGDFSVVLFF